MTNAARGPSDGAPFGAGPPARGVRLCSSCGCETRASCGGGGRWVGRCVWASDPRACLPQAGSRARTLAPCVRKQTLSIGERSTQRQAIVATLLRLAFLFPQSVAWKSFPSCGIVRGFPGREVTGSDFFRKVLASSCSLFCTPFSRAGSVRGDEILRSQHGISPLTLSGLWKSLWMPRWISFLRYRVSA